MHHGRTRAYITTVVMLTALFICCTTTSLMAQSAKLTVKFGIDNLIDSKFEPLRGKKIALVANIASRTRFLEETAQVLSRTSQLKLCALLTPEHGYFAQVPAGERVAGEIIYGIPTYSLYGKTRRPTKSMISSCDAVVIDLQDVGVRPYTYISTMYNVMDACAEYGVPVYVLDRPNPLGGACVDGNVLENELRSFVGIVPVPYLHGMTIGELALMINEEGWLPKDVVASPRKCNLVVVKMKRWRRSMQWESLGNTWIPTSPNIASVNSIRGMALTGLLGELSMVSVGIGTGLPFQYFGLPDFNTASMDDVLKNLRNYNVRSVLVRFIPTAGKFANTQCSGMLFNFPPGSDSKLYSAALELMVGLRREYPTLFYDSLAHSTKQQMFTKVAGTRDLFTMLSSRDADDNAIRQLANKGVAEFVSSREKYLLYE